MTARLLYGTDVFDGLAQIEKESVHVCVTSPPYWGLRDYDVAGQLGLEPTPEAFVTKMVEVFRSVREVLRPDGSLWVNMGDTYWAGKGKSGHGGKGYQQLRSESGASFNSPEAHVGGKGRTRPQDRKHETIKPKDLIGIPWRLALALQADGWYLRSDIIWSKPNPMPESVVDRPTKSHEYIFFLTKSPKYFYNAEAIKEDSVYKEPPRQPSGWATEGDHRELKGRYRESAPKGSFNGKDKRA